MQGYISIIVFLTALSIPLWYLHQARKEIKSLETNYQKSRDQYWDMCSDHRIELKHKDKKHQEDLNTWLTDIENLESRLGKFTSCNLYTKR